MENKSARLYAYTNKHGAKYAWEYETEVNDWDLWWNFHNREWEIDYEFTPYCYDFYEFGPLSLYEK